MENRYCENCRTELPAKASACPACGVFAGDVFDGKMPRQSRRGAWSLLVLAAVIVAAGLALWKYMPAIGGRERPRERPPEVRVVGDRPGGTRRPGGAKVSEAEAIRLLRRHLVTTTNIGADCVVTISDGFADGAYVLTVHDRCGHVKLGRYKVDGKTGAVSR